MVDMLTIKSETQKRISFLDVTVIHEDKTFTTSLYSKPTFSEVYIHFESLLPSAHKFGTVYTFTYRCLRICSSWTKLHSELVCLKEILKKWQQWYIPYSLIFKLEN